MQSRIDALVEMAKLQPDNEMIWYGLGSEYFKLEQWGDAVDALRKVTSLKPDYTAAFQMLGSALLNQGKTEEARQIWNEGIDVATRTGAWKAKQHMEGLLVGSATNSASGLCND